MDDPGRVSQSQPAPEVLLAEREQVYISESTGQVAQCTTTASRVGAYVGAIPHWLYFTPLRKHEPE